MNPDLKKTGINIAKLEELLKNWFDAVSENVGKTSAVTGHRPH